MLLELIKLKFQHQKETQKYMRMHNAVVAFNNRKKNAKASNVVSLLVAYPPSVLREQIFSQAAKVKDLELQMKTLMSTKQFQCLSLFNKYGVYVLYSLALSLGLLYISYMAS